MLGSAKQRGSCWTPAATSGWLLPRAGRGVGNVEYHWNIILVIPLTGWLNHWRKTGRCACKMTVEKIMTEEHSCWNTKGRVFAMSQGLSCWELTGSKTCLRSWQAARWLETIHCPTGNSRDSLDDVVLVPECCPSWVRRKKIRIKTKNISASLVSAWQRDGSSRCTYAPGTGLAGKSLLCACGVYPYTIRVSLNSLYCTGLLRPVKEDLENHLGCLFTPAIVHSLFIQVKKWFEDMFCSVA